MKVLVRENTAEINVKNSRFIAEAFIIESQAEAREKLHDQKKRYPDASHPELQDAPCLTFLKAAKLQTY